MFHVYHEMIYILLKNNNENVHGVSFAQDPIIAGSLEAAYSLNWVQVGICLRP